VPDIVCVRQIWGVALARLACCRATQCVLLLHGNGCLPPSPPSEEGTSSMTERCACMHRLTWRLAPLPPTWSRLINFFFFYFQCGIFPMKHTVVIDQVKCRQALLLLMLLSRANLDLIDINTMIWVTSDEAIKILIMKPRRQECCGLCVQC